MYGRASRRPGPCTEFFSRLHRVPRVARSRCRSRGARPSSPGCPGGAVVRLHGLRSLRRPVRTHVPHARPMSTIPRQRWAPRPLASPTRRSTLVPGLNQQPLIWCAGRSSAMVDYCSPGPLLSQDVVRARGPNLPCAGWRVQEWNHIHGLRIENRRIAVRALRNRSARLDELVNPPQACNARLPGRDSIASGESASEAVHLRESPPSR